MLFLLLLLVLFGDGEVVELLEGWLVDRAGVVQRPRQQRLLEEVPIDHSAARKQRILQLQMLPLSLRVLVVRYYCPDCPFAFLSLLLGPEQLDDYALAKRIKIFI